jgi:hypothetical protein
MTHDEQLATFDPWWKRRSSEERAVLIENRRSEFTAQHWDMVMDADPIGPTPVVAVVSDLDVARRFRLGGLLAEYVRHKSGSADHRAS